MEEYETLTKKQYSLDDSFDFFEYISDRSDEEYCLNHITLTNLTEQEIEENKLLSKANLELQDLLEQTQKEAKVMSFKANCFIFFHKFLLFGALIINLINGIVANINSKLLFVKIGPFLAGFIGGIAATFNLAEHGTERKRVSVLLKIMVGKIKQAMVCRNYEQKIREIDEIKKKLAEANLSLFKISMSEDRTL